MKTNEEIVDEFDREFTDRGQGWKNIWIYRDCGRALILGLRSFLCNVLRSKDAEWKKKMIEILERMPDWNQTGQAGLAQKVENWQQEQINKLKDEKQ